MVTDDLARAIAPAKLVASKSGFAGAYPILYSFFDRDGRLDAAAMRLQVEACIAAGAHGIAGLGIVSEVSKLDTNERREWLHVVADCIAGRIPLAITVAEPSVHGQIEFARAAKAEGAAWIILQPPQIRKTSQRELISFLGTVAEKSELPVAIQNNPVNLDVWLTNSSLATLNRNHPNISILKHDAPPCDISSCIEETDGAFDVFCGLGGRELPACLRAGCVGVIPAPDCIATQVRIVELLQSARPEDQNLGQMLHFGILPELSFTQSSPEHMLCYGKLLMSWRVGLPNPFPRLPCISPTSFGLDEARLLYLKSMRLCSAVGEQEAFAVGSSLQR